MTTTYTGVNGGGAYPNTITGPSAGEYVTAASVGIIAQGAANLAKRLYDMKVDRAGDTMTGKLTVTAAAASNQAGVDSTGDGAGPGVYATGGAGDGTGVFARGGASNGNGIDTAGDGLGSGVVAVGGDAAGYGVYVTGGSHPAGVGGIGVRTAGGVGPGGTGVALEVGAGNAVFTGTSPAAGADPGANNLLSGANITKAWGIITTDAAGNVTVQGDYNIASVALTSSYAEVTFARGFTNKNYSCTVSNASAQAYFCTTEWATTLRTGTTVRIYWKDATAAGAALNPQTEVLAVDLQAVGRQT